MRYDVGTSTLGNTARIPRIRSDCNTIAMWASAILQYLVKELVLTI